MSQKKFPKWKTGKKGRKTIHTYKKLLYKKALSRRKKSKKSKGIFGRKRKESGRKKNKGIFSRKNLEIFGTICMLSLAVVIFGHAIGWNPMAKRQPDMVQQELSDSEDYQILPAGEGPCGRPEIIQDFIVENPYSRSGIPLEQVNGVVIHYVANAGSTAEENRNYFENLKDTHLTKASSHFIIGLDGEIIQCIPLDEISYASNERNSDTISIECCHKKENGKFTKKTYRSLVKLTAWLCATYGIEASDVIRHYDVTGKLCPLYFVRHEDAWEEFLSDIQKKLEKNR